MQNKDKLTNLYSQFAQEFKAAMDNKDNGALAKAFQRYSENIQASLLDTAQEIQQTADSTILSRRGIRTLTSAEQSFYGKFIEAAKSETPRQALTGLEKTIPQTIIDTVISDIENRHPLLAALDTVNTYGAVKWIMTEDKKQLAQWGKLTSAITKSLEGTIKEVDFGSQKLTAFIPVPKDLLELGASYIDAYVRTLLADALACGQEYGAVKGTGKDMPISMVRDLDGAVVSGIYTEKEAIVVTSFDVVPYMKLVARLSKKPAAEGETEGRPRIISKVGLIVNPTDYLTKVVPATTVRTPDGSYAQNVFPYPTEVFQCEMLDEGEAILGVMEGDKFKYLFFLSTGKSGNIEYSDDYQFLEDNRVYAVKLLGTGRPADNNCFIKLDISGLVPLTLNVTVNGPLATVETGAELIAATLNKSAVAADDTAKVAVASVGYNITPATAPTLSYQWQVRAKGGNAWTDLTNAYTGYNTAELTVKAADAEKHYRCKVTAAGSATGEVYSNECTVDAAD